MNNIIGINAGGTKVECAIADLSGKILITDTAKSSNYLVAGVEKTSANLFRLISKCLQKLKLTFNDVDKIVIGIAGAGRTKDAKELEDGFIRFLKLRKIKINSVKVVSDALIALQGAFPNSPGCILIAGTGSILFGKDKKGNLYRVGGFGRIIGDEGSGYSIGRKALQSVSNELDGRGEKTILTKLIFNKMKITSNDELITKIYKENFDVASLTPLVISAAEKNDKVSISILEAEAEELSLHIKALMSKMKVKKINVAFNGSLISNNNFYSKLLIKKIDSSLHDITISKPQFSPVEGAILLAKKYLNE